MLLGKTSKYFIILLIFYYFRGAIIRCLSNIVFEHRLLGVSTDLGKECKKQLRAAYLQQEQVDVSFYIVLFTLSIFIV